MIRVLKAQPPSDSSHQCGQYIPQTLKCGDKLWNHDEVRQTDKDIACVMINTYSVTACIDACIYGHRLNGNSIDFKNVSPKNARKIAQK